MIYLIGVERRTQEYFTYAPFYLPEVIFEHRKPDHTSITPYNSQPNIYGRQSSGNEQRTLYLSGQRYGIQMALCSDLRRYNTLKTIDPLVLS